MIDPAMKVHQFAAIDCFEMQVGRTYHAPSVHLYLWHAIEEERGGVGGNRAEQLTSQIALP
jgi:hypothetical protein